MKKKKISSHFGSFAVRAQQAPPMTKASVVIIALIGAPTTRGLPALGENERHLAATTADFERARHKCCLCEGRTPPNRPMEGLRCTVEVDRGPLLRRWLSKSCSQACSAVDSKPMQDHSVTMESIERRKSSCTSSAFEGVLPCADIVHSRKLVARHAQKNYAREGEDFYSVMYAHGEEEEEDVRDVRTGKKLRIDEPLPRPLPWERTPTSVVLEPGEASALLRNT